MIINKTKQKQETRNKKQETRNKKTKNLNIINASLSPYFPVIEILFPSLVVWLFVFIVHH